MLVEAVSEIEHLPGDENGSRRHDEGVVTRTRRPEGRGMAVKERR